MQNGYNGKQSSTGKPEVNRTMALGCFGFMLFVGFGLMTLMFAGAVALLR